MHTCIPRYSPPPPDETNSSRSIIIPRINPPERVSLPSLWREREKEPRICVCIYVFTCTQSHTGARSPCGGRGHWLTDSFGINAKHEEAHSLLRPRTASSSRRKVEHRPRILVSLSLSSRLSSLLHPVDRVSRLCNRARGISENPLALISSGVR